MLDSLSLKIIHRNNPSCTEVRKYSMLPEFQNSHALLETASAKALYLKLVQQLIKDFELANISHDLREDIGPEELQQTLKEKLYFLLLEEFPEYLNLMYIIDVPEKAFQHIEVTDAVEVAEQVAFLILRREWQKVWLKSNYRP